MIAPPPTTAQAISATHIVLDDFAAVEDGKLIVSTVCPRAGKASRYCFARVVGLDPFRFKVIVSRVGANYLVRSRKA